MNTIALWTATILATLIFIAGSYERLFRMPKWFENPPRSFGLITQQTKSSSKFWIPLQILFLLSFITTLITNWTLPAVRFYLLFTLVSFLLVVIPTATYFVREILAFAKMPADTPATPDLLKRSKTWLTWTTSRNLLQLISLLTLIMALKALYKS